MSGVAFVTSFEAVGLDQAVAKLTRLDGFDQGQLMLEVGRLLKTSTEQRFSETKTAPDGTSWPDWSDDYALTRGHGHSLLRSSDDLLSAVDSYATDTEAAVGSNMVYAAIHNFGGEAVDSNIPAREFLGLSDEDRDDIGDIVTRHLDELLDG